jgi:hypothetical protein
MYRDSDDVINQAWEEYLTTMPEATPSSTLPGNLLYSNLTNSLKYIVFYKFFSSL